MDNCNNIAPRGGLGRLDFSFKISHLRLDFLFLMKHTSHVVLPDTSGHFEMERLAFIPACHWSKNITLRWNLTVLKSFDIQLCPFWLGHLMTPVICGWTH